ncbi:MAG: outer membrane protein assembly factor BamA [Candidatus Zixiibacteriota bacterium]
MKTKDPQRMRKTLTSVSVLVVFLFCAQISLAVNIAQIEVSGNRSVDPSLIVNMSGLVVGSELKSTTIQEAIRRIHAMNLFSDVQVEGTQSEEGVKLTVVVKEYPRVVEIEISGNSKVKKEDLKEKISMTPGKVLTPVDTKSAVDKIKSLYDEKGYLSADVQSEVMETENPGQVTLKFKINEGQKVRIKKIYVLGNKAISASKVKKQMENKEARWWRGGGFHPDKYDEDKKKIVEFYKKEGYLDGQVLSDSLWYDSAKKNLFIQIMVSEGERYKFGEVSWDGNKLFSVDKLKTQVKFKPGEIYSQKKYEETLSQVYSLYMEEGHLYAQVEDKTTTRGDVMDIKYHITEGVPANIHYVNIQGNTKTKEKVIRREISILPGQRFRRSLLMRSQRDVTYLNYFSKVEPDYEVLENGDVDLIFKVEEKPTGQVQFGAGYSAQDKLTGNIGLGIPNFLGNGQNVKLSWDFGKTTHTIDFSFTDPWFRDTPTSVGFDVYNTSRIWNSEYTERSKGFGLTLGRRLSWPDNYCRTSWHYGWERVSYEVPEGTDTSTTAKYLAAVHWPRNSANTSLTLVRDSRDLPQFATKGSVLSWTSELAAEYLGGDFAYHKHIFEASYFLTAFWKLVVAAHAKVGVLDGRDRDQAEIYGERFSPGGVYPDGTIRGYSDASIGPVDSQGTLLRGRSELVYNLELQLPLVEQQMYLLTFADAGNAWLSGRAMRPFAFRHKSDRDLFRSSGVGVRLMIPGMGLIGFDFGYGFDHQGKGEWRPHFQLGTTF